MTLRDLLIRKSDNRLAKIVEPGASASAFPEIDYLRIPNYDIDVLSVAVKGDLHLGQWNGTRVVEEPASADFSSPNPDVEFLAAIRGAATLQELQNALLGKIRPGRVKGV